ncbi:hypothetical protein A9267_10040 [Shewanella sp. UCD-FRSSP16_17]|uniref:hypothetical protein n=1 Tax=Shewanella sp. UCD-FRSSP16_17 TaxID=1853256 RepID=UPI0007EECFEF|nr:hypothetical protein [Shewanella sp. UCD-FRSSP16_17]OBT08057.1 hypothetical protein A9267_10040 [Shewanella sp. UCD-FRSSP16_17]
MKPNSDGKYLFESIDFDSLFLPSTQSVAQLLGLPDNAAKTIPFFEKHYGEPLNVSRSSRAEMTGKGVAKPTFKKLINWLTLLAIPVNKLVYMPVMLKTNRAIKVGSNAGLWYSASHGLRLSLVFNRNDNELVTVFDLIDSRAEADYLMLKSLKNQVKEKRIEKDNAFAIWQAQLQTWTEHSLVPVEQLACLSSFSQSPSYPHFYSEEYGIEVVKAVYYLTFDFYLSAIAHYELGISLYYIRCGIKDASEPHNSIIASAINTYVVSDERCTCFGAMLNELRTMLAKKELDSSWRALAAYIDIEESGECIEATKDKQYRQLKDWRNGKNMPSANKLKQFVSNFMNALGGDDIETILALLRIANGIDALVEKLLRQAKDKKVLLIIAEVLSDYPRYFEHYKQSAIKSMQAS